MTGNARNKPPSHWDIKHARQEGYDQGFADGLSQSPDFSEAFQKGFDDGRKSKSRRPRPKLMKALMSGSYRVRYFSGYRTGYGAGIHKARQVELKAMAMRDQQPSNNREEQTR